MPMYKGSFFVLMCLHVHGWFKGTHILEQSRPKRSIQRKGMKQNRPAPSRLARDSNSVRIAAELGNVLLHPPQRKVLVQQTGVEDPPRLDFRRCQEPKRTELVAG
jgi:hypothetical protein